jgi:hypothetical protein
MKRIFKLLPLFAIVFITLFFSCEKDSDVTVDNETQSRKIDVIGHFVKGDSIRNINKDLDLFLGSRFEQRNISPSEDIISNIYGFTLDTDRILQLSGSTYTNYIFNIRRDYTTTDEFENYMLTVFNDGSYMQVLIHYPLISDAGILEPDVSNALVTYINDASLLTGIETSPCPNTTEEIISWDAEANCIEIDCTGGPSHSYGETCNASADQQPMRICSGAWVVTGCITTGGGGSSSGTGPFNPPSGGSQNPDDPNNEIEEEVPVVPLVPAWQEIQNCMNDGNLGSSTFLSSAQIDWLQSIGKSSRAINEYLKSTSCDFEARDFILEAIETMMLENISFEEFILRKVEDVLDNNPLALLEIDCGQIQYWQILAQHTAPQSVLNKIDALPSSWTNSFYIQELDNAGGTAVNMDYFGVKVTTLPMKPNSNPAVRYTADEYLDYIRRNFNNFVDGSTFEPYCEFASMCQTETDLWASSNPVGSIIYIDIPGDDGVVVCTKYTNNYWYFMTMNAPYAGNHPVSGTRQFGYETNADGSYSFFVRGTDRFNSNIVENLVYGITFGGDVFSGADTLWESFQTKLKDHVNNNFGSSVIKQPTKNRPDWEKVKKVLKGELPITELGCNN